MNEQEKMIKACVNVIIDTIANAIYADPHQWSKRPCETCKTITGILGKPFGCYRYQEESQEKPE
jgi:hypothetical protein